MVVSAGEGLPGWMESGGMVQHLQEGRLRVKAQKGCVSKNHWLRE